MNTTHYRSAGINIFYLLSIFFILLSSNVKGQTIAGPSPVYTGTTATYSFSNGTIYNHPKWVISNGTMLSSSSSGSFYQVVVRWTTAGTGSVVFMNSYTTIKGRSITVYQGACTNPPTPNAYLYVSPNPCGEKSIVRSTEPPSGVIWYWQTTMNGKSEANSDKTLMVSTSGTYFLRAKSTVGTGDCWSSVIGVSVTANPIVPVPNDPTVSSNSCGDRVLAKSGSPPSGIGWYWQGTNPNGTDYASAVATASSYTASLTGTNKYYIRARKSDGCWSDSKSISVFIDKPSKPYNNSFSYCEWDEISLTTSGYSGNLRWYENGQLKHTGTTYNPGPRDNGNYIFKVKNVSALGCESEAADVTLNVGGVNCDKYINWNEQVSYGVDENGNSIPVSASRGYYDGFGNTLQSQSKSFSTNQILAVQNIMDAQGQASVSTLPAPINSNTFSYRYRFITNTSKQKYSHSDFDLLTTNGTAGEVDNPKAVGNNGVGTVGWYYSSSNTLEPQAPISNFPYSRSWVELGPDPKSAKAAGPGDQFRMGTNHEVKSERSIISSSGMSYYMTLGHYFQITHFVPGETPGSTPEKIGYQYILTDPNGKISTSFVDFEGKTLATALITGVTTTGYYIYENWSYTFYNKVGQIIASVAPNGVNQSSTAYPNFVTLYKYDHLGRLVETTSTDEGTSKFVYSTDGQIRFSQNQEQRVAVPARFSYTNYDKLGRLIEAGEYTMSGSGYFIFEPPNAITSHSKSIHRIVDLKGAAGALDAARCTDWSKIYYDIPASDYPADPGHLHQNYLIGDVSKTENSNAKTWYSYDEFGQLEWMKQEILDLGVKTVDYTYDFLGNVLEVAYQKGATDAFYHHYYYNSDQQLTTVHTSKDGVNKTLQATYTYYLHGPLKRVELADGLQGIDYVYTISGALKAINHADPAKDPGQDGINNAVGEDVFGMTLAYHDGDYQGAGYNTGTIAVPGYDEQYGGAIKAVSWHNGTEIGASRVYAYDYDEKYQLSQADWGEMTGSGNYSFLKATDAAHQESIPGYDKHGNIQNLIRKGSVGNVLGNYTYNYQAGTNKVTSINDQGASIVSYGYDAIGRTTTQTEESGIMKLSYDAYGLVKEVRDEGNQLKVLFRYDDKGNRVCKEVYDDAGSPALRVWYVRDIAGNVMSIYQEDVTNGLPAAQNEVPVYGASRLAVYKPQVWTTFYEITDHLGSVRAVIGIPETLTYSATIETDAEADEAKDFPNYYETTRSHPLYASKWRE